MGRSAPRLALFCIGIATLGFAPTAATAATKTATAAAKLASSDEGPPVVDNLSAATGVKVEGARTAWSTTVGSVVTDYVAGRSAAGDLIVYHHPAGSSWQAINVSVATGQPLGQLTRLPTFTSWIAADKQRIASHVATRGPNGELLVFYSTTPTQW